MRKVLIVLSLSLFVSAYSFAATNNSSNPPTFLWLDICTNGVGDVAGIIPIPRMAPDVFDVGVDLGADGTVDRWLSGETTEFLGRDNADAISGSAWRRYYIRLDADAGKMATIRIVDNSPNYYIAINAIRLNYSDGTVVPNLVPNGSFEDATPLNGWTIKSGSITNPAQLIIDDPNSQYSLYSSRFFSTRTNPAGTNNAETVVVESAPFMLAAPTSFIYGQVSGGGSELWNKPGAQGSDNASYVYIDVGTASQDPNGQFDAGTDIPLTGFIGLDGTNVRNQNHPVFFNTSGLEGRRAQVVAVDNSEVFHIGLDSFRMNWDNSVIRNGGFDEGIPVPGDGDPNGELWFSESALEWSEHSSGSIPGWTVKQTGDASVYFFDKASHGSMFSGRTYVGTGGFGNEDRFLTGVELRSDVFVIQPVPAPSSSVFMQFASAQGSARERYNSADRSLIRGAIQLRVDTNGDGQFDETSDFVYNQVNQGMGQNLNTSNMDLWQYPEYRFYIQPEHYGKNAQIYIEDTLPSGYGWMCADDFYFWNGSTVVQPFPNSDFEMGNLTNWNEVSVGGNLRSWLSGSEAAYLDGRVEHLSMNNRHTTVDGDFSVDAAANEYGVGDGGTGVITSVSFVIPSLAGSPVENWFLFE